MHDIYAAHCARIRANPAQAAAIFHEFVVALRGGAARRPAPPAYREPPEPPPLAVALRDLCRREAREVVAAAVELLREGADRE